MFMSRCLLCLLVMAVLMPLGTAQAAVIGFWDFEEFAVGDSIGSDNIVLDKSGNDRHLVALFNPGTTVPGANGTSTATFLGGTGQRFEFIPGFSAFNNSALIASSSDIVLSATGGTSESFTIEVIVELPHNADNNSGSGGEGGILGKGDFVTNSGVDGWGITAFNFSGHPNSLEGFIGDAASGLGTSRIAKPLETGITNDWHHIAMVRDRDNDSIQFYVDGVPGASKVGALTRGVLDNAVGNFVIGNNDSSPTTSSKFFRGAIDMVKISDVALDPSQFMLIVPEPATSVMMLVGALGLAAFRRRR